MTTNEKLQQLSSGDDATWLNEAEKDLERTGAQENSWRLALRVLTLLREKGMSQTELAEKMGVHRQRVTTIVKGQENFTFETVDKLEKALHEKLMTISEPKENVWQWLAAAKQAHYPTSYAGSNYLDAVSYSQANELYFVVELGRTNNLAFMPASNNISGTIREINLRLKQRLGYPKVDIVSPGSITDRFRMESRTLIKKNTGGFEYSMV